MSTEAKAQAQPAGAAAGAAAAAAAGAGALSLDGTLRAIVAADRQVTASGKELLHRRLTVFYGYFALLGVLAGITTRVRQLPVDMDPRVISFVLNVQTAHALVLCIVFVALRFRVRTDQTHVMRALDVLATVATAAVAAFGVSAVSRAVTVDMAVVSFFVLFFVVRAALVPSKPWAATLVAAVSLIPFTFGLSVMYRRAGVDDPEGATYASLRSMASGVVAVYVVSKTIYGLRRAVEKAVQLGQYVVHEKIGEGGMGAVYRASHAMLKRPTAIKVIPPDRSGETATARFEREVMATSRLTHPNNVAIYDFGRTEGGVFYYAMELLDGEDLARLVERDGPQSVARTRHILRQIAAALVEAHDTGLVHRDVKPQNVMLCTRGGVKDFVKVLDFGLVKDVGGSGGGEDAMKITSERAIAGTPLYMSPESIVTPQEVGPAADVYAFGCVGYFLLTARPPFEGDNLVEVCAAHLHSTPKPPSAFAPDGVTDDLEALILKCLEKKPQDRPTTRALESMLA